MKSVGWNNGKFHESGAGYGIKINKNDRDRYFRREWKYIFIDLKGNDEIKVNISPSFWRDCSELRHIRIGKLMIKGGLAPWPKNNPPKFELEYLDNRRFKLTYL